MIKTFAEWLTFEIFKISSGTLLADAVNFFIYDTIKIFLLLAVILFAVSIIRSFLSPEKVRSVLSRKGKYTGNLMAGILGIVTPFCTCSAVPLFLGFIEAGIPLGVTFSFLVASPMINEVALVLLLGIFGWKVALLYIVSGLAIAVIAGIIIGKLRVENLVRDFSMKNKNSGNAKRSFPAWKQRLIYAKKYTLRTISRIWVYVVAAIAIGAIIHGYVPADLIARWAGGDNWYAVPLAVLLGIPLYSSCGGAIPLVAVLAEKGVSTGTALAFMMAVTGLSFPEFVILKKVMRTKLIVIFAGIVGIGIIFTGYLFNLVLR